MPGSDVLHLEAKSFVSDKIAHGFFGRRGGVSDGLYASLNCGPGSGDNVAHVTENRSRVVKALGGGTILSLYQVHGDTCLQVDQAWGAERPQADAHVTDVPGLALSILTADCAPVLFYGEKPDGAPVIGAAHAGWRGAIGGVLDKTVAAMVTRGADLETIHACIGPCIGKKSYEVSEEFYQTFLKSDEENDRFFGAGLKAGHYMFDLAGYCAARLAGLGLSKVHMLDEDTFAKEGDFFSFRRTTHRKEPDYGRQISAILIKSA